MVTQLEITNEKKEIAEAQIRNLRKPVDYNTIEYPIEVLVKKYLDGIDENENEIFIPDHQREMTWDEDRQSKFIESVLLGLPIPYIFVADTSESEDLAHGFRSFQEVGKNATADELLEIKKRVICYLKEILKNIDEYIIKQEYLK